MSDATRQGPFDDSNEADRLDQEEPAVPDTVDPEDDPTPADYDDTSAGSEGDWLDQAEEVDIDEEQLNRG